MKLTPESVIEASGDQLSTGIGDETVILELSDGVYFSVAGVGEAVWRAIAIPHTVQEICDEIVAEFDAEPARCLEDVLRFAQELIDHKLARIEQGPNARNTK